ncbi:MAG: CBS domain-containing protein [Aggregatilineales bacterium]
MFENIKVKDWMTEDVVSVSPDTPIAAAHQIMKKNGVRRLPVLDDGMLVGIITIGDVREASPSDATTLSIWELNYLWAQLTVGKIMSKQILTVTPESSIFDVSKIMLESKVSGLPVINDNGALIGIITESDVFKMIVKLQDAKV